MRSSPFAAVLLAASLLAGATSAALAAGDPPSECPTGTCSGRVPAYTDTAWTNHFLGKRIAAGTMQGQAPTDYVVSLFDLSTNVPALDTNWAGMQRYHGRVGGSGFGGWNVDSLGTVFGITLDDAGNIYVCASSSYNGDAISNAPGATAGSIFKIDRVTAYVSVFATLPNSFDPAYSGNPAEGMPGLGNITYDPVHQLLFVSNFEDGKIYRLNMSGAILGTYDPMLPDNGLPGFAPLGERVWAVQWHTDNKIYFSLWNADSRTSGPANLIHSLSLDGSGNFVPSSELPVISVPPLPTYTYSYPVSDISFTPGGQMMLAERCMFDESLVTAHQGRLLEYSCDLGTWYLMPNPHDIGNYVGPPYFGSAGGTDADYAPYVAGGVNGRHWVTGDAIHYLSDYIYGAQGFPPAGGSTVNSMLFDYDGIVVNVDKFEIGDIEITCPVDTGSIHGGKYRDEDCDGQRDPGETGIAGWPIVVTGPSGTVTVYTDASGIFHLWGLPNGTYTVCELGAAGWTQTQPAGGCYTVVLNGAAVTGRVFGNCQACPQPQGPCKPLPWTGVLWLPFDEPTGAIAHDVAGGNPGQISGDLAAIHNPVAMDKGLRFNVAGDHVRSADSPSLDFGTGDFSLVSSFELDQVAGQHFLFDKRQAGPAGLRGYALSVEDGSVVVRMQDGTAPPVYTSGAVMTPGSHHSLAVTVSRTPDGTGGGGAGGFVYLDGALLGSFDPAPSGTPIDVSNDAPLSIGTNSAGTSAFGGWIDEPMVFARALPFADAIGPWNPVICKQWCVVPPTVSFGPYATSATATFTICNYDFSAPSMNYSWSLNGLPAGSCSVNGPTVYSPSSGSMTIPAGSCQSVTVTITRPSWLTPGSSGCFVFNVSNNTNHTCFSCTGKAVASKKWWVIDDIDWIGVGHGTTKQARFTVTSAEPVGTSRDVSLRVMAGVPGDSPASQYISLNGLPPGEPILLTRTVAGGGSTDVDVTVSYPTWSHLPEQWLTVQVLDEEGDPEMTTIANTNIRLEDGEVLAVQPPPAAAGLMDAVSAWPNPARGSTHIRLSLAKASRVEAGVYDLAGRMVRKLQRGTLAAGAHDLQWDGRDDGGRAVQAGLYFVRMTADEREYGARLVLVR